jgi:hypothetical protein
MGKRGPRPNGEFASKGATLSARITVATRKRLDEAAERTGNSLSQEVERRLSQSFENELPMQPASERMLLRVIGELIDRAGDFTGQSWLDNPYTFELITEAMALLMRAFRPPGDPKMPETIEPHRRLHEMAAISAEAKEKARVDMEKHLPIEVFARSIALETIRALRAAKDADENASPVMQHAAEYLDGLLTDPHLNFGQSAIINESATTDDGRPVKIWSWPGGGPSKGKEEKS